MRLEKTRGRRKGLLLLLLTARILWAEENFKTAQNKFSSGLEPQRQFLDFDWHSNIFPRLTI